MAVVVGVCMLGAGLLRAVLLFADRAIARMALVRTPPRRAVRVWSGVAAGVLVVVVALALGAFGFAHREYDKFIHGTNEQHSAQTRDRLSEVTNDGRLPLWKAALRIYETDSLHGTGAGTYQLYYTRYRTVRSYVVDTHSLYLQSLSELGIVGFVLILVVVFGMLVGLAARIRGPGRGLYAALFARDARLGDPPGGRLGLADAGGHAGRVHARRAWRSRGPPTAGPGASGCPSAARSSRSAGS